MMENIYNDKVRLLRELDKQRDQTLTHLEGAKLQQEARASYDDRLTRERQEWVRQAAEKATERGRAAMSQANEWARLKETEENYHRTCRDEVIRDEAAKAKQQAADWRWRQADQQAGDLPRKAKLTREEQDYPKAKANKPITIKPTITTTKPQPTENAAESKPFEVPPNIEEARRKAALERGQDEMTNKQLKAEHTRLIAELEMLRRGEVKPNVTKRLPQGCRPVKREEASRGRWGTVEVHEAGLGPKSKPKTCEQNAWEMRREADEANTRHNVKVQPSSKPQVAQDHRPQAKESARLPSKPQSTPSTKVNKPSWVDASASEDEGLDKYDSYVKTSFEAPTIDARWEAAPDTTEGSEEVLGEAGEGLYSGGIADLAEPLFYPPYTTNSMKNDHSKLTPVYQRSREDAEVDDEYEYSDLSYESDQENQTINPDLSQRQTIRLLEDDEVINDLSAKRSEIRQIYRDVQDCTPPPQDRGRTDSADDYRAEVSPAISQFDPPPEKRSTTNSLHPGNSAPKSHFPVSAAANELNTSNRAVEARGLQYYIDILTTPSSQQPKLHDEFEVNREQTEASLIRDIRPKEEPALQDGFRHQLIRRENKRWRRQANEAADDSRVSHTMDAKLHLTKNSPSASQTGQTSHEATDITNPLIKPIAWDIDATPDKAKSRDEPNQNSDRSPAQQLQIEKPAQAWVIDLDADSPSKSLSNAFEAKKRSLAEKLEHRDLKPKEATRAKTKEELLKIRKQMLKAPTTPKVCEVDVKKVQPVKSGVMGRLASGERTKVR
jgi:hypothetical protein